MIIDNAITNLRKADCQPQGTYRYWLHPFGWQERPYYGLRFGQTMAGLMLQVLVPVIDDQLQWINLRRAS